jgi:hypothetical protein
MWIGLILVTLNLVMKWGQIKAVVFAGAPDNPNAPSSGGSSGGGGFKLPFPMWPGTNIPIL